MWRGTYSLHTSLWDHVLYTWCEYLCKWRRYKGVIFAFKRWFFLKTKYFGILGKRFVDHWGITTPVSGNPSDPFGYTRRNNAMDNLQQGHANQDLYPGHAFPSSAYKCGYSGEKAIMDVNFNADDAMESGSVMCGSASRVFVFADGNSTTRSGGNTSFHCNDSSKEWNRLLYTGEPLMTSTPVDASAVKPVSTSTPHGGTSLPKGFLSPEEMLMYGGYNINLNTSPNLRVRLFSSSEASSDGSLVRKSCSTTSATGSSSAGASGGSDGENGLWRPWW